MPKPNNASKPRGKGGIAKRPKVVQPQTQSEPPVKPQFEILSDGIRFGDRTLRISNIPANLDKTIAFALAVGPLAPAAALDLLIGNSNGTNLYKIFFNHPTFNSTVEAVESLSTGQFGTTTNPSGPLPATWLEMRRLTDVYTNHETSEHAHFATLNQGYANRSPEIESWINSILDTAFKDFSDHYKSDPLSPGEFAFLMVVLACGIGITVTTMLIVVVVTGIKLNRHKDYEQPEANNRTSGTGEAAPLLGSGSADAASSSVPSRWSLTAALTAVGFLKTPAGNTNVGGSAEDRVDHVRQPL